MGFSEVIAQKPSYGKWLDGLKELYVEFFVPNAETLSTGRKIDAAKSMALYLAMRHDIYKPLFEGFGRRHGRHQHQLQRMQTFPFYDVTAFVKLGFDHRQPAVYSTGSSPNTTPLQEMFAPGMAYNIFPYNKTVEKRLEERLSREGLSAKRTFQGIVHERQYYKVVKYKLSRRTVDGS